jgi:hypothetical protein
LRTSILYKLLLQEGSPIVTKSIILYCLVDDILKNLRHIEDIRRRMSDAEVITTVLMSMLLFGGNIEKSRRILKELNLIPDMISKSQLNRRLHELDDLILELFTYFADIFKKSSDSFRYIIDSFPVAVCDNIRISRSKLVKGEQYRGKIASKRRYFYGVKVQVVTTEGGIPVEIAFLPGSAHDSRAFDLMSFDLPPGSEIYADSAYTDYSVEDDMLIADEISLCPQRKKISTRQDVMPIRLFKSYLRKRIETSFSGINQYLPRKIHAVTFKGFLLKVFLFVFGFALDKALLTT